MQRCACTCHSGSSPLRTLQNPQSFRRSLCLRSGDLPTSTRKTIIGQRRKRRWCSKYQDCPIHCILTNLDLPRDGAYDQFIRQKGRLEQNLRNQLSAAKHAQQYGPAICEAHIRHLSGEHHAPTGSLPLPRIQTLVNDDRDWGVSWLDRTPPNSPDLLPTCQFLPSPLPLLRLFERRWDPSPPAMRSSSFFGRIRRLSGEHYTPTGSPPLHRNTPPSPLPTGAAPCPAIPTLWIRTGHLRPVCIGASPGFCTTSLSYLPPFPILELNATNEFTCEIRHDAINVQHAALTVSATMSLRLQAAC